jgi:methylthioribose-1-phosphate isomerase
MTGDVIHPALHWDGSAVVAIDQTALPSCLRVVQLTTVDEVVDAVRRLVVRGAPVIGVTGALGVALAARLHSTPDGRLDEAAVRRDAQRIADARPTAVNLRWAVERVLTRLPEGADAVLDEALAVLSEDERTSRAAARHAADVLRVACPDRPLRVLTHCNTGSLAAMGGGTALGAIRELARDGRLEEVLATETRPLLQGARLTVWELREANVPHRLCVDSAAASAMAAGLVDAVVVGADRIAANGDTANKIGTYALACAAARHRIPFVVVAPRSTVDADTPHGNAIPIEQRDSAEVTHLGGAPTTAADTPVYNPAFDVTPADLITAIATEDGAWGPDTRDVPDEFGPGRGSVLVSHDTARHEPPRHQAQGRTP